MRTSVLILQAPSRSSALPFLRDSAFWDSDVPESTRDSLLTSVYIFIAWCICIQSHSWWTFFQINPFSLSWKITLINQITDYAHSLSCHDAEVSVLYQQVKLGHEYKNSQTTDAFNKHVIFFGVWNTGRKEHFFGWLQVWLQIKHPDNPIRGGWCRFQRQVTVNSWLHSCWSLLKQQTFTDPTIRWLDCC